VTAEEGICVISCSRNYEFFVSEQWRGCTFENATGTENIIDPKNGARLLRAVMNSQN